MRSEYLVAAAACRYCGSTPMSASGDECQNCSTAIELLAGMEQSIAEAVISIADGIRNGTLRREV